MKSALIRSLVALAFAALFSGCLQPKTSGMVVEKGRLTIENTSVALDLQLLKDAVELTPEGRLHAQVFVQNANQTDLRFQCRFQWWSKNGLEMTHVPSPWRPVVLHGREKTVLETVCPQAGAEDFRLIIRALED